MARSWMAGRPSIVFGVRRARAFASGRRRRPPEGQRRQTAVRILVGFCVLRPLFVCLSGGKCGPQGH
eukprot:11204562-Lingulodinium_polyedra.AAC.1